MSSKSKETCRNIHTIAEMCAVIALNMQCDPINGRAKISRDLQYVYDLIQKTPETILTDQDGSLVTDNPVTPTSDVYCYGFRLYCDGFVSTVRQETILIKDQTPICTLLDPTVPIEDCHYEAICRLKDYYCSLLEQCNQGLWWGAHNNAVGGSCSR